MRIKRFTAQLLAAIVILTAVGCTEADKTPAALTYGETSVSEAVYSYYVSTYKARYIQEYSDITDSADFFKSEIGGKTGEEIMKGLVFDNVAQNLIAAEEFRLAGLELSKDDRDEIDEYIDSMAEEYADGTKKGLSEALSEFGINTDTFRDILTMERQALRHYEYLYGSEGVSEVTVADRNKYFTENYVRFDQIFINDRLVYETDEDGDFVQDTSGNYVTRELTEDEAADAAKRISAVEAGLEAGEDFAALKEKYSDSTDYSRGYYFSAASSTDYITSVVSAAFSLDEGEWMRVDAASDRGAFFIKRLPLESGAYTDEELSDFFGSFEDELCDALYSDMIAERVSSIVKNEEFLSTVSVEKALANYYYY